MKIQRNKDQQAAKTNDKNKDATKTDVAKKDVIVRKVTIKKDEAEYKKQKTIVNEYDDGGELQCKGHDIEYIDVLANPLHEKLLIENNIDVDKEVLRQLQDFKKQALEMKNV